MRKLSGGVWILAVSTLLVSGLKAQGTGFACTPASAAPVTLRAEGLSELLSDVVLICSGGTPTAAGQAIPQFTFTLQFTANVTSAPTAGNQFTESLLFIDEPGTGVNPTRPILNCGNTGAPDNGGSGAGVCSIVSTGTPATEYDGTPNGYGSATCDGASGRPASNSYSCGRPNAFQGRLGTPQNPGQLNALTFYNVPFDPPGSNASRVIRFSNLRVNAASAAISSPNALSSIVASLSASGPLPVSIANAERTVGYIFAGLATDSASCGTASGTSVIRVCERLPAGWRPRNFAAAVGNGGVSGNATFPQGGSYWAYNGGTNNPADVAQNVPGSTYNTEAGFEWQNNGANAPPASNPPQGLGTVTVTTRSSPLTSGVYGTNTGINSAGIAAAGTRIAVRFGGIPQGASVQVPKTIYLTNGTVSQSGVMVLTNTDSAGAGAFSAAASGTLAGNLAVYEVLWADPFSLEHADITYTLLNAPGGTVLQVTAGLAPFYTASAAQQSNSSYSQPRFLDPSELCAGAHGEQICLSSSPNQGVNSGPVQVSFTYLGGANLSGASVLLRVSGMADILGTNVSSPASNMLTATFNLSGAATGSRDVVITPATGPQIVYPGAFTIIQTPPCGYSVGPQSLSFTAAGGSGSLTVTPSDLQCAWTASAGAGWITLGQVFASLPLSQPFTVAANAGSSRSGSITIAGETIPVSQAGTSSCAYSLSATSNIFPTSGGTFAVNVTTQPGCNWNATSQPNWITYSGSSSGSGSGTVTLQAASNSGAPLSATMTIAGQTFQVRQSGDACGATDVSSRISTDRKALLGPFYGTFPIVYSQQLVLTNHGAAVSGPVYAVFDGLCSADGPAYCPFQTTYSTTSCHVPTSHPSPMVLVAPSGIAQGQTVTFNLQFNSSPYVIPAIAIHQVVPSDSVSIRVLTGTPNQ